MTANASSWELIYWPGVPGRGQMIRLVLEEGGVTYKDFALEGRAGAAEVVKHTAPDFKDGDNIPSFACPIVRHDGFQIAQSMAILLYLSEQLNLCPKDRKSAIQAHQLVLTVFDLQEEYTHSHHPIGEGKLEDHNSEALKNADEFRTRRLPKFLGYFNRVLALSSSPYLLPTGEFSYADVALFSTINGLKYSFPNLMARELAKADKVQKLWEEVRNRERIKNFLASSRCIPYSDGMYMRVEGTDIAGELKP